MDALMAFRVILLNYLREPAGLRSLAVQMNSHRAYRVFSTTSDHFLADDMVTAMEKITENKVRTWAVIALIIGFVVSKQVRI